MLELSEPFLEGFLSKTPVATQLDMRDAAGAGLRPDPARLDAETLGDLVGGQQTVHDRQAAESPVRAINFSRRVSGGLRSVWFPHTVSGRRG